MVWTALNCLRVGGWISVVSTRFETVSHSLKQLRTVAQSHTVANSCERFETVASSRVQSGPGPCRTAQELGRPAGPDRAKTAVGLGGGSRSGGDPSARLATRRPSGVAASRRHKGEAVPCAAGGSGSPGAAGCKAAAGGARDGATEHGQRRTVRSVASPPLSPPFMRPGL
jgi:hypothetical protein